MAPCQLSPCLATKSTALANLVPPRRTITPVPKVPPGPLWTTAAPGLMHPPDHHAIPLFRPSTNKNATLGYCFCEQRQYNTSTKTRVPSRSRVTTRTHTQSYTIAPKWPSCHLIFAWPHREMTSPTPSKLPAPDKFVGPSSEQCPLSLETSHAQVRGVVRL